jgi:hypothetical protein
MKTKLLLVGLLAGIFAFNPVFSNSVSADEAGSKAPSKAVKSSTVEATDKAQKTRGGGTGEPVPSEMMINDPNTVIAPPPDKGGAKTRGDWCRLHVNNHTGLKIVISIDGQVVGMVFPWGDVYGNYDEGAHILNAVAYYTDGSTSSFGPRQVSYCSGPLAWSLYP